MEKKNTLMKFPVNWDGVWSQTTESSEHHKLTMPSVKLRKGPKAFVLTSSVRNAPLT